MTNKNKQGAPKIVASGYLEAFNNIPVYNLDNGQRVFRFTDMTLALRGIAHGKFANYLAADNIKEYIPRKLWPEGKERIPQGITEADNNGQKISTYDANDFIDVCLAFITAKEQGVKLSVAQQEIVERVTKFIIATAKLGITGLIDEATGYQYIRQPNELQMKMAFFLADELRPWEKTFPDKFWEELGRLTEWTDLKRRPKYWGKLVNEFIYEAIDNDIAKYLQENKPPKYTGQRYHQWLEENRGVKVLIEHIWTVIGLAKTCKTVNELRYEVNKNFSKNLFQPMLFDRKELSSGGEPSKIRTNKEGFTKLLDKAIKPSSLKNKK